MIHTLGDLYFQHDNCQRNRSRIHKESIRRSEPNREEDKEYEKASHKRKPYMANQILTQKLTNSQENANIFHPLDRQK